MVNYLAQFQTIKSVCDHLVIAGKSFFSWIKLLNFGFGFLFYFYVVDWLWSGFVFNLWLDFYVEIVKIGINIGDLRFLVDFVKWAVEFLKLGIGLKYGKLNQIG